jgi:ribosomal protein S18 acetylase RimI-like enzyme
MKESPIIRKILAEEVSELCEVARKAFVQAFTEGNKPENVKAYLEEAFSLSQFQAEMQEPASTFYGAFLANQLIGYTKINQTPAQTDIHDQESIEIARLYVLEDYLGMGIGKILLDTALGMGKELHKKYLWLGVWEKNARAIRFYEKNGLNIFGSHPFPFGDEIQTDFLMKIDLF